MPNKIDVPQKHKFNASQFEMKTFIIIVDLVTDGNKKQTSITTFAIDLAEHDHVIP
ncbi:UNVERIFIED_CONTAM: hypothetical protein FKN15_004732 [Acipenser sinensis]